MPTHAPNRLSVALGLLQKAQKAGTSLMLGKDDGIFIIGPQCPELLDSLRPYKPELLALLRGEHLLPFIDRCPVVTPKGPGRLLGLTGKAHVLFGDNDTGKVELFDPWQVQLS